jgi:hypothetical protein
MMMTIMSHINRVTYFRLFLHSCTFLQIAPPSSLLWQSPCGQSFHSSVTPRACFPVRRTLPSSLSVSVMIGLHPSLFFLLQPLLRLSFHKRFALLNHTSYRSILFQHEYSYSPTQRRAPPRPCTLEFFHTAAPRRNQWIRYANRCAWTDSISERAASRSQRK